MVKLLSLFSGIGAFEKALQKLSIEYDLVGYCEIDNYASKAYSLIHHVPETLNLGDITKVDVNELSKDIDLLTYGFPCQDVSIAGERKGFACEGEFTRTGLFYNALNIITAVKPKYAVAENVRNLLSDNFKKDFDVVLDCLDKANYNNYYAVLNAKDFGIPQFRERVFIVSIRKDVDDDCFYFPKRVKLEKVLRDILETNVSEKYYVSSKIPFDISDYGEVNVPYYSVNQIGNLFPSSTRDNPNQGRVYDFNGISPTLNCMGGGSRQPFIVIGSRVRKLTPKECFRLMGFDDIDVNVLIDNKISNTQLYKMAGNSIVVNVLVALLRNLLCPDEREPTEFLF